MFHVLLLLLICAASAANAMVGGAPLAQPGIARHVVLIVGSRGNSCTGVAISQDIVLTVAHCVQPGADYKWVDFDASGAPSLHDVATIERHPNFSMKTFLNARATADIALLKLARPLPASFVPVPLTPPAKTPAVGHRLLVAGFGVTIQGDGKSGGKIRAASLAVTGQPGTLQIRLVDPATGNARDGLGACTGDSGAPAFDMGVSPPAVVGLVSWSTAANNESGCGGLTGVTPLVRYRAWIMDTMTRLRLGVLPNM
jgi:secreted trypsin-like serine protease